MCVSMRPISTCTAKEENVGPRYELGHQYFYGPVNVPIFTALVQCHRHTTIIKFSTHRGAFENMNVIIG